MSAPAFAKAAIARDRGRQRSLIRALDLTRLYREPVRTEEDPSVELLLCAADLSVRGVDFALTAAVEALGLAFTDVAMTAAHEARDVGSLYGDAMGAEAFLEAAYRLMEGKGSS